MAVAKSQGVAAGFATAMKRGHYSWQNLDTKDQNLLYHTQTNFIRRKNIEEKTSTAAMMFWLSVIGCYIYSHHTFLIEEFYPHRFIIHT